MAAQAVEAHLRNGTALEGYGHEIVRRYGSGEVGWVGRQLSRAPDAMARALVHTVLRTPAARRHLVFGHIFGMRVATS
jgi:hypothetical protein